MNDLVLLQALAELLGIYEFLPSNELFVLAGKDVCEDKAVTQIICENIMFLVAGYTSDQLNTVRVRALLLK